ncbi:MAG: prepilin-type cleavage/methylation domain-containing protein [Planctomycetota bacterium]
MVVSLGLRFRPGVETNAFTLLELILTLAMSVVLLSLVGSAVTFYTRTMDAGQTDVRQLTLASSILQMIEDDLRLTQFGDPIDPTPLEDLIGTTAEGEGTGDLSAAGIESTASDTSGSDAVVADAATTDLSSTAMVLVKPGVLGNQFQLQCDVSRLPRLEDYNVMMEIQDPSELTDPPSDLKTVSYFVQPDTLMTGVSDDLSEDPLEGSGGLVRRVLDRRVTQLAMTTGGATRLASTGDLIAPEVVGLEFEYFDGTAWLLAWNSDEMGALPYAIRIQLSLRPLGAESTVGSDAAVRTLTHVVRLPAATSIPATTEEDLSGTSSEVSGI